MADKTSGGPLARSLKALRSINWRSGDSYVIESIEYVNPNGPPPGDPFSDPEKTARLLERARQSILNRPCLCGKPTCGNVGCPRDGRTYRAAILCGCWPDPDADPAGMPGYEALHPYDSTKRGHVCLFTPEGTDA